MKFTRVLNMFFRGIFTIAMVVLAYHAGAGELQLETGWLKSEKGHKGDMLGATVTDVQQSDGKLTITIPKKQAPKIKDIEEVLVVGEKPEKLELPDMKKVKYEFIKDYDNDNYGLVIYLGRRNQIPFRLYLKGEDTEP